MASGLNQKRILVTDTESDFGKEVANALVTEGALVFMFMKECRGMQQVLNEHPQLTPILLDINKEKCQEEARKLILSLPTIDHFVNLSGDGALNIISQAYPNSKINDVNDIKAKPLITKMGESGGRGFIFNVSFGNQNIMSKLKANLDPRFTNSKTAQISTNFRLSLKKMFTGGTGETSRTNGNPSAASSRQTEEVIVKETQVASNFAAIATSLNQSKPNTNENTPAENSTRSNRSDNPRVQTLQEKNTKIRQSLLKLQKTCAKKWKKAEKRIAKEEVSALKALHKDIDKSKKAEKAKIMKQISDANATTANRANALSTDTANKILEARENRADKEVDKHAQKKLEKETTTILEHKNTQLTEYHEKLYKKMVERQINEFNRIKSKYLV